MMMNKVIFSLLLCLPTLAWAQTDQITALREIPDLTEYVKFFNVKKAPKGYYKATIQKQNDGGEKPYFLIHRKNLIGELGSFFLKDEDFKNDITGDAEFRRKELRHSYHTPNHPTKGGYFFRNFRDDPVYIFLDGLIYQLERRTTKEQVESGNFTIDYIYQKKSEYEKKSNQHKFMQRLKNEGICVSKAVSDRDHYALLKAYITKMKAAEETEEWTAEQKKRYEELAQREQYRRDSFLTKSIEDRKNLKFADSDDRGKDQVTVIVTGGKVCLIQGGSGRMVNSTATFDCDEDIYYGTIQDGRNCTLTKQGLAVPKGRCGQEIELSGR